MIGFIICSIVLAGAVALGIVIHLQLQREQGVPEGSMLRQDRSGWIYFIGNVDQGPIKVGMSAYEPNSQRLPELKTMSPIPLKVMFKAPVDNRFIAETALHHELEAYREHGEWFDRDAALAYADHLRGES